MLGLEKNQLFARGLRTESKCLLALRRQKLPYSTLRLQIFARHYLPSIGRENRKTDIDLLMKIGGAADNPISNLLYLRRTSRMTLVTNHNRCFGLRPTLRFANCAWPETLSSRWQRHRHLLLIVYEEAPRLPE